MTKRLWIAIAVLFVVNLVIAYAATVDVIQADGTHVVLNRWDTVTSNALAMVLWIPFIAMLVSGLGALIPRQGLPYGKRFPLVFAIVLTAMFVGWTVVGVLRLMNVNVIDLR